MVAAGSHKYMDEIWRVAVAPVGHADIIMSKKAIYCTQKRRKMLGYSVGLYVGNVAGHAW